MTDVWPTMSYGIITVIVLIAVIMFWRIIKDRRYVYNVAKRALPLWAVGISLCLLGAILMFDGGFLGDGKTGIAAIIGISIIGMGTTIGIGLIVNQEKRSKGIKP